MKKMLFCVMGLVILVVASSGCSLPSTPASATHAPFALPTLIPPTKIPPTATSTPTLTPTLVPPTPTLPPATPTVVATLGTPDQATATVVIPTASPSPTPTFTPLASPTSAVPRGLYVTDLRIDPPPVRGVDLKFYATFLNLMEREQNYRWAVYVFRADTQRGTGETTRSDAPIPTGTVERPSNGSWKLPLGGPCEYFYAQVGWLNTENKIVWFTEPSGSLFQKGFSVCPP